MDAVNVLRGLAASRAHRFDGTYDRLAAATGGIGPDYDYGRRGFVNETTGHSSDSGKLPSHPTFSTHSAYSTPSNPGGTFKTVGGKDEWVYTPAPSQMIANGKYNEDYLDGLAHYFKLEKGKGIDYINMPAPYARPVELQGIPTTQSKD